MIIFQQISLLIYTLSSVGNCATNLSAFFSSPPVVLGGRAE